MSVQINQHPLYNELPVGQEVMFAVTQNTIVATEFNVKFIAKVYISDTFINFTADQHVGDFKTTPNNVGAGIFNFRPVIETFVSPDNQGFKETPYGGTTLAGSTYKTSILTHPIHLIDKFSLNKTSVRYMAIQFVIESSAGADSIIEIHEDEMVNSDKYILFNGVLQYDDVLTQLAVSGTVHNAIGYNLKANNFIPFSGGSQDKCLSNAPKTQYARLTDYGTLPFLQMMPDFNDEVIRFDLKYYDSSDSLLDAETILNEAANGGTDLYTQHSAVNLEYFGAFPANLRGWSSAFEALVTAGADIAYYTVRPITNFSSGITPYTINIICPNERGYEGIRLTWLNQWGAWDYYTFNMKSTKSVTTNKVSWTQLGGTWNENAYRVSGYKGGKKNFRVNATEKIKINTDFVSEAEGVWFEELINSPEVYIVNEYSTDIDINTITNKYIEPVRLTTSNYIKKTIANDRLMQYTIEIEKSKTKRTQAV